MSIKGFPDSSTNVKTPNDIGVSEKPLNTNKLKARRVDINVLKSKLEEEQSKELRKNIIIFSLCVVLLGSVGVYLSL